MPSLRTVPICLGRIEDLQYVHGASPVRGGKDHVWIDSELLSYSKRRSAGDLVLGAPQTYSVQWLTIACVESIIVPSMSKSCGAC